MNGEDLVDSIENIRSDTYRVDFLKKIKGIYITNDDYCNIISKFSSDTYKVDASKLLNKLIIGITTQSVIKLIGLVSSDTYKVNMLKTFKDNIYGFMTVINIKNIIYHMSGTYQVDILRNIVHKIDGLLLCSQVSDIINIVNSDTYKVEALKVLKNNIGEGSKSEIIKVISSDSYKNSAMEILITIATKNEDNHNYKQNFYNTYFNNNHNITHSFNTQYINDRDITRNINTIDSSYINNEVDDLKKEIAKIKEEKNIQLALLQSQLDHNNTSNKEEISEKNDIDCSICFERKKNILFNDCKHICVCEECVLMVKKNNINNDIFICPLCRLENYSFVKVFL